MSVVQPGVCRHCGCTENNACRLEDGEMCCWIDYSRLVCSNPKCMRAEGARLAAARAARTMDRPKRLTPADVHAMIRGRGRRKKRRAA
jgi:hypothetical protein